MDFRVSRFAARACIRNAATPPRKITGCYALLLSLIGLPPLLLSGSADAPALLSATQRLGASGTLGALAVQLGSAALCLLLHFGYCNYILTLSRSSSAGSYALFAPFRRPFRLLGAFAALALPLLVLLGGAVALLYALRGSSLYFVAFAAVLAALLFLYLSYRFAIFSLVEYPDASLLSALRYARQVVRGNYGTVLKLELSFLWYYLLLAILPSLPDFALAVAAVKGYSVTLSAGESTALFCLVYLVGRFLLLRSQLVYAETSAACCYNALCDSAAAVPPAARD